MSCLSSMECWACLRMIRRHAGAVLRSVSIASSLLLSVAWAEGGAVNSGNAGGEVTGHSAKVRAAPAEQGAAADSAAPGVVHSSVRGTAGTRSPTASSTESGEKQKSASGNFSINKTEGGTVVDAAAGSELFSFPGVEESRQKLPPAASIIFHKLRKPYVFAEFRQVSSPGSVRKESSGYLKIDGSVICFLVEKPVPITYRIDSALSTFIITIDGRRSEERLLDQQTMNGLFIKAVASIFTGDLDFAWKVFRLSAHSEKGDWWTFVIEPSEEEFKSLSGPIRFYGSSYLNTIESVDAGDGHMISTISFKNHSEKRDDEPEALQAGCR